MHVFRFHPFAFICLFCISVILFTSSLSVPALADDDDDGNPRYASIVIDAETGAILHQDNADKILHPASLTKIMTLLLTFEAIESGKLKADQRIRVSKFAAGMRPSKIGLKAGQTIKVEDAIYALVTKSANDISVALAEAIAGSEAAFARQMTRRAKDIGMSRTQFYNASGLPNKYQVSTAKDMARLARFIIRNYPSYYRVFAKRNFTYGGKTHRNHNRLMESYAGMDGIKTGYIHASGFNLVASARRSGHRLIGVVFGGRTSASRNAHMAKLLDAGFRRLNKGAYGDERTASYSSARSSNQETIAQPILKPTSPETPRLQQQAPPQPQAPRYIQPTPVLPTGNPQGQVLGQLKVTPQGQMQAMPNTAPVTNQGFGNWSVQIGAYQNRAATDQALYQAFSRLPSELRHAQTQIVPLRTAEATWVFRARLTGLSQQEAQQACRYFRDCITVAPNTMN
jgi:D-alanyl-D-alanine carboxypeptidase